MAVNERLFGTHGYLEDFPGLHVDSVHWLADHDIVMFGVEAISPAPAGEPNFKAHIACAERGITHMECLANLDRLVGRGRFRFIGFPAAHTGRDRKPDPGGRAVRIVCRQAAWRHAAPTGRERPAPGEPAARVTGDEPNRRVPARGGLSGNMDGRVGRPRRAPFGTGDER